MFGYHGRYLRVDLAAGTGTWVSLGDDDLARFVGGVGLGTLLLHRANPPGVDPFDPAAAVVFAFSPLVGTPLTTSAKFAVVCKSPLTGRLNDALSSSHFAIAGKKAGGDAIVLTGACREPSVLVVDDGRVSLRPAGGLWGLPVDEASARLAEELPGFRCAVIGPAGENRVRFATLSADGRHAGRGGTGAVLGAKNLKAVAVRGTQHVAVADPAGVVAAARDLSKRSFGPATAKYRELGTVANLLTFNRLHALPTRNFSAGSFEGAGELSAEALADARKLARSSCAACTIGCEHVYRAPDGAGVRLEYESLFALGPLCGVAERDAVLAAAKFCDSAGMDTISAGATAAFAMECGERGLLPGPVPRFGDGDGLLSLLKQMARREGVGAVLAEGTRRAAEVIGGRSEAFAPHVKGMELPGYEPRALQAMALGFAVGSRGADHNRSGAYEVDFSPHADRLHGSPDAARLAAGTEDKAALIDSLILCKFLRGVFADLFAEAADLLRLVTGRGVTAGELRETAERVVVAKKLFNEREGWTAAEDTLPERFLSTGLDAGAAGEARLPRERLTAMVAAYYAARGWGADGRVPPGRARALELGELLRG